MHALWSSCSVPTTTIGHPTSRLSTSGWSSGSPAVTALRTHWPGRGGCCSGTSSPPRCATSGPTAPTWSGSTSLRPGVDTLLFDELVGPTCGDQRARHVRPADRRVRAGVRAGPRQAAAREPRPPGRTREWRHRETRTAWARRALWSAPVPSAGRSRGCCARSAWTCAGPAAPRAPTTPTSAGGRQCRPGDHVGWADYVVIAAPLTEPTRGLVDAAVLRRDATDRAPDQRRARRERRRGRPARRAARGALDGASLDVFGTEPLPADHPLWSAPGWSSRRTCRGDVVGWRDTLARQFVDNAVRWLDGEPLVNVVDKRLGLRPRRDAQ